MAEDKKKKTTSFVQKSLFQRIFLAKSRVPRTKKYRKKPVVVDVYRTDKELYIETLEGIHKANAGDYIITGIKGEQYPCKPDIFEATYEPVDE